MIKKTETFLIILEIRLCAVFHLVHLSPRGAYVISIELDEPMKPFKILTPLFPRPVLLIFPAFYCFKETIET